MIVSSFYLHHTIYQMAKTTKNTAILKAKTPKSLSHHQKKVMFEKMQISYYQYLQEQLSKLKKIQHTLDTMTQS